MNTIISNDGVEIPAEGMSFEVIEHFGTPEQAVTTMVLKELLRGLNVVVREGNSQSQAASFCSYARQMGFETEDEIIAAEPWVLSPKKNRQGEDYFPAWQLISQWEQAVREERAEKALTSMKGKPITPEQIASINGDGDERVGYIALLQEKGFNALADKMHDTIQIGDRAEVSLLIGRARTLLGMNDPRSARNNSNNVEDTHVSDEKVADVKEDSKPEPF